MAILLDVDQGLAHFLHERGCRSIAALLRDYDLDTLAEIYRPWGESVKKVGRRAATSILNHARAMVENRVIVLGPPHLPEVSSLVMFDLEGLPPHVEKKESVFLWGLKVFGEQPSQFQYACAFPGQADDQAAWFAFLHLAGRLFDAHGDIPFVHWAAYESSKLRLYVERYGDRDGIAARVRANLLDLLPVMAKSVCLPLPTRSLKEVEKFVGFQRQELPGSGDWAIAKYLQAAEVGDRRLLDEILGYNEEDLDATWAVYEWVNNSLDRGLSQKEQPPNSVHFPWGLVPSPGPLANQCGRLFLWDARCRRRYLFALLFQKVSCRRVRSTDRGRGRSGNDNLISGLPEMGNDDIAPPGYDTGAEWKCPALYPPKSSSCARRSRLRPAGRSPAVGS